MKVLKNRHLVPLAGFNIWDKVFKNGPSKICGRQSLKNFSGIISSSQQCYSFPQYFVLQLVILFIPVSFFQFTILFIPVSDITYSSQRYCIFQSATLYLLISSVIFLFHLKAYSKSVISDFEQIPDIFLLFFFLHFPFYYL